MEIEGIIERIEQTNQVSDQFKKRDFVIQTEEQYPQSILLQCTQDKVDLLNNLKEGDKVKATFNLRGRNWTNPEGEVVTFNTLQAWKIEILSSTNVQATPVSTAATAPSENQENITDEKDAENIDVVEDDDLPF